MAKLRTIGATLLALASLAAAGSARAQTTEIDADFSKYCRENFSNSVYQRRQQSWGTQHACMQGGTPQGIDIAEACRLTTGNATYRKLGARILCAPGDGPAEAEGDLLTGEDYLQYCRTNFPNSIYEKRSESTGIVHYCRIPGATGGFTLQNINLGAACGAAKGASNFRVNGGRVRCVNGGSDEADTDPKPADVWIGKWKFRITYAQVNVTHDLAFEVKRIGGKYIINIESKNKALLAKIDKTVLEFNFDDPLNTNVKLRITGRDSFAGRLTMPNLPPTGDIVGTRRKS